MCGTPYSIRKHLLSMNNLSAIIATATGPLKRSAVNRQSVTDYVDYADPVTGKGSHRRISAAVVSGHTITLNPDRYCTGSVN